MVQRFRGGAVEDIANTFGYGQLSNQARLAINPLQFLLTELGESFTIVMAPVTALIAILMTAVTIISFVVEGLTNLLKLLYELAQAAGNVGEAAFYASTGRLGKAADAWSRVGEDWDPWGMGATMKFADTSAALWSAAAQQAGGQGQSRKLYEAEGVLEAQIRQEMEQGTAGGGLQLQVVTEPGMRASLVNGGREQAIEQGSNLGYQPDENQQFAQKHGHAGRIQGGR